MCFEYGTLHCRVYKALCCNEKPILLSTMPVLRFLEIVMLFFVSNCLSRMIPTN